MVKLNIVVWSIYLIAFTVSVGLLVVFHYMNKLDDYYILSAVWARIAAYCTSFLVEWLILYLLVKVSNSSYNEQFDKVCKKKFLNYLDEEHIESEVTWEEREAAKENMDKFVMRQEADEKRGGRRE